MLVVHAITLQESDSAVNIHLFSLLPQSLGSTLYLFQTVLGVIQCHDTNSTTFCNLGGHSRSLCVLFLKNLQDHFAINEK